MPQLVTSWYKLGLKLGAAAGTLDIIQKSYRDDLEKCCMEMLQNWLNGKENCGDCERTWDGLLPVVKSAVGCEASALIKRDILHWKEAGESVRQGTTESKHCIMYTPFLW